MGALLVRRRPDRSAAYAACLAAALVCTTAAHAQPAYPQKPIRLVVPFHEVLVLVIGAPDMKDKLAAQGLDPVGNTPQQFAAVIKSEIAKWAKVVKASGAKPE
jgi:tripartite-type tricarboxylate transporter receptor subunit TctC